MSGELRFRDAEPGDEAAVRAVVAEVLAEYGLALDPAGTDTDLDDLRGSYLARGGAFRVLVNAAGRVVGCGGLYPLEGGAAEIRKMYFRPEARRRGLGRALLEELLARARAAGFARCVLETNSVLVEAIALYRSAGFVETCGGVHSGRCDRGFVLELLPPRW